MIDTVTHTDQRLVSQDKNYRTLAIGIIVALIGIGLLIGGGFIGGTAMWIMLGVGALGLIIGLAVILFRASYTYTFDKQAGKLTISTEGIMRGEEQAHDLENISRIVKWRQVHHDHNDEHGSDRRVVMHYILEFTNGDQFTLIKDQRHNWGWISMLSQAARSDVPQPIQDIADFLEIEVVSENPNPAEAVNNVVDSLTGSRE